MTGREFDRCCPGGRLFVPSDIALLDRLRGRRAKRWSPVHGRMSSPSIASESLPVQPRHVYAIAQSQ